MKLKKCVATILNPKVLFSWEMLQYNNAVLNKKYIRYGISQLFVNKHTSILCKINAILCLALNSTSKIELLFKRFIDTMVWKWRTQSWFWN